MNRTLIWFISLIASLAVFLLLGLHMQWVAVSHVLLAAFVLFHGFYGLRTMLVEFWPGPRAGIWVTGGCTLTAAGLFMLVLMTELLV